MPNSTETDADRVAWFSGLLRAVLRLTCFRVCLGLSIALGLALLGIPLLSIHGVESALALGIALPPMAALIAARIALRGRAAGQRDPLRLAAESATAGLLLLAAPTAILALNALRVRNCEPLQGLAFILLGPGASVVLASLAGTFTGALPLRPALASVLALLLPVAEMGRALYGLYATPAVFAYGHFFGYFPGALYDQLVALPDALLTLRALTAVACVMLVGGLRAFYAPQLCRLALSIAPGGRRAAGLWAACAALLAIGASRGQELGHRTSVEHIAKLLGGKLESHRCNLIVPREMRRVRRERMAADCDFRVGQLERWFGVKQPGRIRVFVFRSADEKRALMGAAQTNIAKPWRQEIYLQDDVWPHPVMPHELAHIVAGNTARGPMKIAGPLHGLLPDFALIEGVAVAAAWSTSAPSGITPHQWVRAMYELGIAPPLSAVVGGGFLNQQHRLAYMLTGSLLRYVADTHGSAALRRIYLGSSIVDGLGIELAELERRYRAFIMAIELPESARALAKQRFSGSSILSSVCPHAKAELRAELDGHLMADDTAQAEKTCRKLLAIDPAETGVRGTLVTVMARRGDEAGAELELARLQGPPAAPAPLIASVLQALGDEAWRNGDFERAQRTYRELLGWPNDRDALRQLQVRALAFEGSTHQRDLLFTLLVGEPGAPSEGPLAVYLCRELRLERMDGLPYYLEARQLLGRERFTEAVELLGESRQLGLPSPELLLEARRIEAIGQFAVGALDASAALWSELAAAPGQLGIQAEARDWLERIRAQRTR